jgi:hypothetical protein
MNLRNIANAVTSRVNPNLVAQWLAYAGYTVLPSGKTQPVYAAPANIQIQAQAITSQDLQKIDAMNLSEITRVILTSAKVQDLDRESQTGGDLLVFDNATWLVAGIIEDWSTSGWMRVGLIRQNGG